MDNNTLVIPFKNVVDIPVNGTLVLNANINHIWFLIKGANPIDKNNFEYAIVEKEKLIQLLFSGYEFVVIGSDKFSYLRLSKEFIDSVYDYVEEKHMHYLLETQNERHMIFYGTKEWQEVFIQHIPNNSWKIKAIKALRENGKVDEYKMFSTNTFALGQDAHSREIEYWDWYFNEDK